MITKKAKGAFLKTRLLYIDTYGAAYSSPTTLMFTLCLTSL